MISFDLSDYIPNLCHKLMTMQSSEEEALQHFLEQLYADDGHCQDFTYQSMLQLFSEHIDQSTGSKFSDTVSALLAAKLKSCLQHALGSIRRAINLVGIPQQSRPTIHHLMVRWLCGTFNDFAAMHLDLAKIRTSWMLALHS